MLALDTNILIALQKREAWADEAYRTAISGGKVVAVPTVVRYEARRSLLKPEYLRRLSRLDALLAFVQSLEFDAEAADLAAHLHHQLRSIGTLIDETDLLIAATAIRHGVTLVTRNTKHFERIPGLSLTDWQQENP